MNTVLNRKRALFAILFCAVCNFAQAQSSKPAAPAPAARFRPMGKGCRRFRSCRPDESRRRRTRCCSSDHRPSSAGKRSSRTIPAHPIINRGFGGNEIADSTHFADRMIFPYQPRMIFLRAGGNDIHNGKTAEQVFADFKEFVATVHAQAAQDRNRLHLAVTEHRAVGRTRRREEAQCAHRGLRQKDTPPEIHRNLRPGARCQGRTSAGALRRGQAALQPRGLQAPHRADPPVHSELMRESGG